jgi:hypothetical protein
LRLSCREAIFLLIPYSWISAGDFEMSRKLASAAFLALLLTAALYAGPPSGGDYAVASSTLDAGGGVSTGGDFVLMGTVGQPDAGAHPTTGNDYALAGGFWGKISAIAELIFMDGFE